MDPFIQGIAAVIQPPLNYVFGVAAIILMGLPQVMDAREKWRAARSNLRELEYEKLRLEVLLLRRQVDEARIQEYVPDILPEIAFEAGPISIERGILADVIAPPSPPQPAPAPATPGSVRRFVATHPRIGRPLMWLAQIALAPVIAMFGLSAIGILMIGFTEQNAEFTPALSVFLAILYGGLGWLSYRGFRGAASVRRAG